jgi:stage II sporulation protein D
MVLRYNSISFLFSLIVLTQCVTIQGAKKVSLKERPQDTDIVYDELPADAPHETHIQEHSCTVRILLDERDMDEKGTWDFESAEGFTMSDELVPTRIAPWGKNLLTIGHADGDLYVDGRRCVKKKLHVIPSNGTIAANGRTYHGSMWIVAHQGSWLLINVINLEDYVYSVLQTESWPGWPLEVNKVFAITSRTYAIAMMLRAHAKKLPYHLRNTNVHQTYEGVHTNTDLWRAVEKTKGLFLGYAKKPILAMFDSCCGGIIPAHIKDFDFSKAPYLAREYACTHCKRCKIFSWEVKYELAHLERIIENEFPHLTKIKKLEVIKWDKAGLADKVSIATRKHKESISGKKLYSLLKEVKSFSFDIQMRDGMVHIKGNGYGHHLGLCQWGAREMVRDGSDYRTILRYYYPGTCFMSLT